MAEGIAQEKMCPAVRSLWSLCYPDQHPRRFNELLNQNTRATDHVLEIGAGSGRNLQHHFELRGKVARHVGIDPDANVLTNPHLDEAYQASAESLPFESESFDVVFHNYVAEHFESPLQCYREIGRVLKSGGILLFETPSKYYYACLAAQITPQCFHEFYVRHFGSGRLEKEVFRTFYRFNDDRTIARELKSCGFKCEIEHHSVPPGYLRFSRPSFLVGVLYERSVERWFPALRAAIIVTARRQAAPRSHSLRG